MVNVFITLTARNMRPDLRIIARAEDPATEKKLKQAGANEIILPAFAGGMQIANSITHPSLDSILKDGSRHLNNDLKELGVEDHRASRRAERRGRPQDRRSSCCAASRRTAWSLAIKKPDGSLVQHPPTAPTGSRPTTWS